MKGTMDGKVCIVTGATSGIGLVTARVLAERGVGDRLWRVSEELTHLGSRGAE